MKDKKKEENIQRIHRLEFTYQIILKFDYVGLNPFSCGNKCKFGKRPISVNPDRRK